MLDNDHIPQETDQFQIEGMHDMLLKHNRINIEDIGDDAADQGVDQAYIEAYFNEAFAALTKYDTEDYQNYFDIDSWAKMFLMVEVSKTYDCYAGNFLMHRDGLTPDDKLIAGPAWDYDIAFGRTLHKFLVGQTEPMQLNAEGWYNDSVGLFAVDKPVSLLQELGKHASFMREVAKVYNENRALFEDLAANVDRQRELLRDSALMNNVLWGTHSLSADYLVAPMTMSLLGTGKYALHYQVTFTWDNYVYNLKEFASKRVMWLNDHLKTETPAGTIVQKSCMTALRALVVLTAGSDRNTYQWQRSAGRRLGGRRGRDRRAAGRLRRRAVPLRRDERGRRDLHDARRLHRRPPRTCPPPPQASALRTRRPRSRTVPSGSVWTAATSEPIPSRAPAAAGRSATRTESTSPSSASSSSAPASPASGRWRTAFSPPVPPWPSRSPARS